MDISDYVAILEKEGERLPNGHFKYFVIGLKSRISGEKRSQYVYLSLRDNGDCVTVTYYSPIMDDERGTSDEEKQVNCLPGILEAIGNEEKGFGSSGTGLALMEVSGELHYCLVVRDLLRAQLPGSEEVTTIIPPKVMIAAAEQYAQAFDLFEEVLEDIGVIDYTDLH